MPSDVFACDFIATIAGNSKSDETALRLQSDGKCVSFI